MVIPTVVQGLEVHGFSDLSFKIEHGVIRTNMTLYKAQQNTDMVRVSLFCLHTFWGFFLCLVVLLVDMLANTLKSFLIVES